MGLSVTPGSKVCELAMRAEDSVQSVATAVAGLRRIGLAPVLVGQRPTLGKRVVRAGRSALHWLAQQGVPPDRLQAAMEAFAADDPKPDHNATIGAPTEASLSDTAIQRRWLAAQANEALRLLGAGMALRPADVDHLLVSTHGFPRWRGGPMHQADRRGLLVLRHDLRAWAATDAFWTPAPLLDRLVGEGLRLADLDRRL